MRVSTRNDLVRKFADTVRRVRARATSSYLEGTGLVDYAALPAPSPGLFAGDRTFGGHLIVPGIVVLGALLATVGLLTTLRRRGRPGEDRLRPDTGSRPSAS